MSKKKSIWSLTKYELRNMAGTPWMYIFGVIMPIGFSLLFSTIGMSQAGGAGQNVKEFTSTAICISVGMMIPLASILVSCAVQTAQEIEKKIPLRMRLFGFTESKILIARGLAELVIATLSMMLYWGVNGVALPLQRPTAGAVLAWLFCFYLFSVILYCMAYGLAGLLKKFGITYGVTMILYFAIMMLSGMMGLQTSNLPKGLQMISNLIPTTYVTNDFISFWQGGDYNWMPLVQSFLFFGAVSGINLFIALYKSKRILK